MTEMTENKLSGRVIGMALKEQSPVYNLCVNSLRLNFLRFGLFVMIFAGHACFGAEQTRENSNTLSMPDSFVDIAPPAGCTSRTDTCGRSSEGINIGNPYKTSPVPLFQALSSSNPETDSGTADGHADFMPQRLISKPVPAIIAESADGIWIKTAKIAGWLLMLTGVVFLFFKRQKR